MLGSRSVAGTLGRHCARRAFRLMANAGDRQTALDILARLDERYSQMQPSPDGRL
jgi:hypothetical protein